MNDGNVVLVPLPQADGQVKNRPAIVLRAMPPHGDLLVCGVSTQLHHEVVGFDDAIKPGDARFRRQWAAGGIADSSRVPGGAAGEQLHRRDRVDQPGAAPPTRRAAGAADRGAATVS